MPILNLKQSDWEGNVYVVTTTRAFVLAGVVYLGRSLYLLVNRYFSAATDTIQETSQGSSGLDHITMASINSAIASLDQAVDVDIDEDLELELRRSQDSHRLHNHPCRPWTHRHEHIQSPEAPTTPAGPVVMAERCTNVPNELTGLGGTRMQSIDISESVEII